MLIGRLKHTKQIQLNLQLGRTEDGRRRDGLDGPTEDIRRRGGRRDEQRTTTPTTGHDWTDGQRKDDDGTDDGTDRRTDDDDGDDGADTSGRTDR